MNRTLIIGILSAGALAACSTTPSHPAVHAAAAVPAGWCSRADDTPLKPGSPGCDSLNKTYSGEQLRQTGFTDVAHALQMLDPEVTIRGQ
jgi:hypothetical protein